MPHERQPLLENAPRFDPIAAARIASVFAAGISHVEPLPSERDQNYLVETGDSRFVLKIANALEAPAMIDAQQRVLSHLVGRFDRCPRVIPALDGSASLRFDGIGGRKHAVWAVSVVPGIPLARVGWRSDALHDDLGRTIGDLSAALAGFEHPAIRRDFHWDLSRGLDTVDLLRPLVLDRDLGHTIDTLADRVRRRTRPRFEGLRRGAIHNDLNDHNILVGGGADPFTRGQSVTGIVDFGDMIHGWIAADVAVAAAYAALDSADPLGVAARIIGGFHARSTLDDADLAAMFGLIVLRLCMSACIAARQLAASPDNEYLNVSQAPIRRTLPRLLATPFGLAEAVFRHACGLEPSPRGARVAAWLGSAGPFPPILDADLRAGPLSIIPLGPGSPLLSGDVRANHEAAVSARIREHMQADGARIGLGLFDEARLLYDTGVIEAGPPPAEEPRMVHFGIDLFAPPGTPVHSPLHGVVHAAGDNAAPRDYGPVIILRHDTGDGIPFYTLFGHLARASLDGLEPGKSVRAGDRIGWIGEAAINGGWTPHVHVQIIADDAVGLDYPGIGRASRRAAWTRLCPDPTVFLMLPPGRLPIPPTPAAALDLRRRVLPPSVRLAYRSPVRLVRGWMQYLWDADARRYLDGYNNVPHVGHAHPRVVAVAARQMALLESNTRYLSDTVNRYAERLTALFPHPLEVVFFVNSGSEATELALRLARAHTGSRHTIVLDAAYHGMTNAAIDISPYKHAGPGGAGPPDWVHVVPRPDDYRGVYRRDDPDRARKYAGHIDEVSTTLAARHERLAGFIAETLPSVAGQIVPPPGYYREVYARVRAAGGLCIADEVQTGFGRTGRHFWAFEADGVVPDIVVLGKPMGNGHPIGAVVTTRAIAASFDNGMEFFSTFGGNTVSCAIGETVLDVIRDESLQAHARAVGDRLLADLRDLMEDHEIVGDVRGSGLFAGVELVRDRSTLEPAAAEAGFVVERLRDRGILIGTDGPFHNVLKIRPPMPFDGRDADRVVESLDRILRHELPERDR